MRMLEKRALLTMLSIGVTMGTGARLKADQGAGWFQGYPPRSLDMRGLVDRSQSDVRDAAELEHGNDKQRGRYRNAQGHLSSFDRDLTRGRFDKSELDKSISSIQGILDHNVLQARSRDALLRDVSDLRMARGRGR